jgi:hypothetical protein
MTVAVTAAPTLEYAQRPRWYRRLRWRRMTTLLLLVTITLIFLFWGRRIMRHSAMLYHQRQCLTYSLPENQVVFDEHPETQGTLLADGNEYQAFVPVHPWSRAAVSHAPHCWQAFQKLGSAATTPRQHVLFLHELVAGNGESRLVCVVLNCEGRFNLQAFVFQPGSITRGPSLIQRFNTRSLVSFPARYITRTKPREGYMRFFAGQVFRDDSSRFYIPYELHLQKHNIHGRLNSEGTEVYFEFPSDSSWRVDKYYTPQEVNALWKMLQNPVQVTPSPPLSAPQQLLPADLLSPDLDRALK